MGVNMTLLTKDDFINFANDNKIPMLFIYDETRPFSSDNLPEIVCFEKDKKKIEMVLPIMYVLTKIRNRNEYTQEMLQIEYDKKELL